MFRLPGTKPPFTGEYTDTKPQVVYQGRTYIYLNFSAKTEKFESNYSLLSFLGPSRSSAVTLCSDSSLEMTHTEVL